MKHHLLCFLCAVLAAGCASVDLTPSPNHVIQGQDANGVSTWAILPKSYNPQIATPWIIYNHGSGQTIDSILTDPPHRLFVESLATAGFVVIASEYRDPVCWDNMECVDDLATIQTLWRSQFNLSPQPFAIGESMGGIVTWNAISHSTLKPLAVVGIYPACSLSAMYADERFTVAIQNAYGFASPSEYITATKGFDPILTSPSTFVHIPIQIWASYSDRLVPRTQNEDPFADAINAAGGSVVIHTSHGDHGDPSNLDSAAVVSFFSSHQH